MLLNVRLSSSLICYYGDDGYNRNNLCDEYQESWSVSDIKFFPFSK